MFERFTDQARRVMALAEEEARGRNHEFLGTEHILLGLVREGNGRGAKVLRDLGVDLATVHTEVDKMIRRGPEMLIMGKLPQTPRAKKVIQYAIEEAQALGQRYVGSEHLVLGLVKDEDGSAAQVLMNLGATLDVVRRQVVKELGQVATPSAEEAERARMVRVVEAAWEEAKICRRETLYTEDVLVGLLRVEGGITERILREMGVTLEGVRVAIDRHRGET